MRRFVWLAWDLLKAMFSYDSTNKGRASSQLLFVAFISVVLFVL